MKKTKKKNIYVVLTSEEKKKKKTFKCLSTFPLIHHWEVMHITGDFHLLVAARRGLTDSTSPAGGAFAAKQNP